MKIKLRKLQNRPSPFSIMRGGRLQPVDLRGLYGGAACFFCSNGPSFADVDFNLITQPGIIRFGVNNGPKVLRPHLWASVDTPAKFLESVWRDPTILKFVGTGKGGQYICRELAENAWRYYGPKVSGCPGVVYMKLQGTERFDAGTFFDDAEIPWGNNKHAGGGRSVFVAAIKLMYELGFRRIYLLGVDFRMTAEFTYAFDEQRDVGAIQGNNTSYMRMLSFFSELSFQLQGRGLEIINCTPGSGLTIIPYMSVEEAVKRELRDFPDVRDEQTWGRYVNNEANKIKPWQKEGIEKRKRGQK